ncbi:glycosyltransferase family 2 protein [Salinimicrobium tongyeongense]|uniref:Glycosyltransferase family 2 protein n=1 Tax=Salinimicrobium tongyeongense TaxID=2809707 RepID=A0ABY6NPJ5_9FLAO|nr:glycosyltransferase family 2 protein [Salinimicrobium tongyeongense]UZH54835.1 glycosyltransferase family 2 protein [Salinimicrobium tongyeongense]
MQVPITVLIPTFNEENLIAQAITCASFADEVLVIDSFSSDKTVEIAESLGCTILKRRFDNFSNQKNYAISKARHDWILVLDADEYLTYELREELIAAVKNPRHNSYKMPFKNYFINRFIDYGSNGKKIKSRFFNRKNCKYTGLVHEQLLCEGSTGVFKGKILHYTYKDLRHFFEKKNQYSQLQAQQLYQKKKKTGYFHLVFKPAYRFLNEYLLRLGFLDGIPGLTSTAMNGYGVLSRYVKLLVLKGEVDNPELTDYNNFTRSLMNRAKEKGFALPKDKKIYSISFFTAPLGSFFKEFLLKGRILKGKEGYIISYLMGFKTFNTKLYHWLHKRNME